MRFDASARHIDTPTVPVLTVAGVTDPELVAFALPLREPTPFVGFVDGKALGVYHPPVPS